MVSKNNRQLIEEKNRNERQRFTLRKLNVGVVSVLVGVAFTIYGGGELVAHADAESPTPAPVEKEAVTSVPSAQVTLRTPASATTGNENPNSSATPSEPAPATNSLVSDAATPEPVKESAAPVTSDAKGSDSAKASQASGTGSEATETVTNVQPTSQAGLLFQPTILAASTSAAPTDQSEVTVTTAQDFYNAVAKGTANVINVGANINLNDLGRYTVAKPVTISNRRDITIQSTAGDRYTIDFGNYTFDMAGSDYSATFNDLDIYGQSWFGLVENPATLNFNNITYHGSQLVYSTRATAVNFSGDNNIQTVNSYVSPLDGQTYYPDGTTTTTNNQQQVIQLTSSNSSVNFKTGTNTVLQTISGNVVEMNARNVTMTVEDGANVTLNPHTGNLVETNLSNVAHGILTNGSATVTVGPNATLTVNTEKTGNDTAVSNGIYLKNGGAVNVQDGGKLIVNTDGQMSTTAGAGPVYIDGASSLTVGNQATFQIKSKNLGSYSGALLYINGTGSLINLNPHSIFSITGDGTGAVTGIRLGSGTFSSDQPDEFNVDLSQNTNAQKKLITNGTINFTRVKEKFNDGSFSGPMKQIVVKYNASGVPTVSSIVGATSAASDQVKNAITAPGANFLYFTLAGQDVTINEPTVNLSPSGQLTGTVSVAGGDNANVYVSVTITKPDGSTITVPANTSLTKPYENDPTNYQAVTDGTGAFTVDLSQYNLTDPANAGDVIHILATKDFINATAQVPVKTLQNKVDKSALQAAVSEQATVQKTPAYYNATQSAQDAYNKAITAGQAVLDNPNATSTDVTNALDNITKAKAGLTGQVTNTSDLKTAVDAKGTTHVTPNYYNATPAQQQAYDNAVTAGQKVLDNPNATQTQVNDAQKAIADAKAALSGQETDTSALKTAVDAQPNVKKTSAYYNAPQSEQDAYNKAVAAGQAVLSNPNATQTQVNDAQKAIDDAKTALTGQATNTSALQTAVDAKSTTHATSKYYNATPEQQQAYDNAVTAGQKVLDDPNATQVQVNDAKAAIDNAKAALGGQITDTSALKTAVGDQAATQKTAAYYNATPEQQQAYDDAVTAGQKVLDDPNATQIQVNDAKTAIDTAKAALNGQITDTSALKTAVDAQPDVQKMAAYYNASQNERDAYNKAVADGQAVLNNPNATQTEVNDAKNAIDSAKAALSGQATDTSALKTAVNDQPLVQKTPAYYNATSDQQKAYDDAVTAGQKVLDNPNAPQAQVNDAQKAIDDAKTALTGQATDTSALKTAVDAKGMTHATPSYYNATPAQQKAYDDAVTAGQKVLDDPNATQAQVNDAKNAIDSAKAALSGQVTDLGALQTAVSDQATVQKTSAYYNATPEQQQAYDDAVTAGQKVLDDPNATQTQVNSAAKAIDDAKAALSGQMTDTNALKTAVNDQEEVQKTPAYYNATPGQQQAYDDAVTAGQKVLDNPNATQTQVNDAKNAIDNAKAALSGQVTDSSALQTAVSDQAATQKTAAYYNATSAQQQAYDNAVAAGQKVMNNPNATQTQVNDAKNAIDSAKAALSGQSTDTSALKTAVDAQPDVKKTPAYYNATPGQQKAYDDAVTAGQKVLDNPNATQVQVNSATQAINTARDALSGQVTNKNALKTGVDDQPTVQKTPAYYNAPQSEQDTYNKAVAAGQAVLNNPDATQDQVNTAIKAINDAKTALSGQTTDISALKTVVDAQSTVQKMPAYYNGSEDAGLLQCDDGPTEGL